MGLSIMNHTETEARVIGRARLILLRTTNSQNDRNGGIAHRSPIFFRRRTRLLSQLGERQRLARLRRELSNATVAQRSGISRGFVHKVESVRPGAIMGSYLRVLAVLGLETDINTLAADD